MYRIIPFRGFEIHVSLAMSAEDPYDVTFQLKGGSNLGVLGRAGRSIQIHNGPFTHRWAYFNAESAGQAAVDTFLDAQHEAWQAGFAWALPSPLDPLGHASNHLDDLALGS